MRRYKVEIKEVESADDQSKTYHITVDINPHEFKFLPKVRELVGDKHCMM